MGFDYSGKPIENLLLPSIEIIANSQQLTATEYTRYVNTVDGYVYYILSTNSFSFTGVIHYDYDATLTEAMNTFENVVNIETGSQLKDWLDTSGVVNFVINGTDGYVGLFSHQSSFNPQNANIFHYSGKTITNLMQSFIVSNLDAIPTIPQNSLIYLIGNTWQDANGNAVECYNAKQVIPNLTAKYLAVDVLETKQISTIKQVNGQLVVWQEDLVDLYLINSNINDAFVIAKQGLTIKGLSVNKQRINWRQTQTETQTESLLKPNQRVARFLVNYWLATDLSTPLPANTIQSATITLN